MAYSLLKSYLIQNSPAVKKCAAQKGHCEKDVKSKVAANSRGEGNTNSPELSLLKFCH